MINMIVRDAADFREQLPATGAFEMYDIAILVEASDFTSVKDIEEISTFLHAAINVVDFKVKKLGLIDQDEIHISITEVPINVVKKIPGNPKKPKKS